VYGLALDRAGSYEGYLDNEVVKVLWPSSRKVVHLGSAFDLKHANRVGFGNGVVYFRLLRKFG
jgi:hypothetical protein